MNKFVHILRGMDDHALGGLIVGAAAARLSLESLDSLPKKILTDGPVAHVSDCHKAASYLSEVIRKRQIEDLGAMASFVMVWLHTVRALSTLELMPKAKEMWRELSRGLPYLDDGKTTVDAVYVALGGKLRDDVVEEALFVPSPFDELEEFDNLTEMLVAQQTTFRDQNAKQELEANERFATDVVNFFAEIASGILGVGGDAAIKFVGRRLSNWEQDFDGFDLKLKDGNLTITASVDPGTNSFLIADFRMTNKLDSSVIRVRCTNTGENQPTYWSGKIRFDKKPHNNTLHFMDCIRSECSKTLYFDLA